MLLVLLLIVAMIHMVYSCDHLHLKDFNAVFYINAADQASQNRIQINWKYLAAIDCIRYKHDFSRANYNSLKSVADMFVINNQADNQSATGSHHYSLRSLPEVLDRLSFSPRERVQVYVYLRDLDNVGLVNNQACLLDKNSSHIKFIDRISKSAIKTYRQYGILPSITIAQAILESGWGESQLCLQANNLFGIKADNSWPGKYLSMVTTEYYNTKTYARFRVYSSINQSISDHGVFLYNNQRYRKYGVFDTSFYGDQARALAQAGYSTKVDKSGKNIYADLLIELIRQYDLQLIDYQVEENAQG